MNNFEPRYIKMASQYLSEKLKKVEKKVNNAYILDDKKESTFNRLLNGIFKS